jgi:16S rRNA (guanine966-N2)-methyltransferase
MGAMRILGGELRGRPLESLPGRATRPMLARVRQALFDTLQPWFPGALVLDLFAGTGSLGLEALSRGARRVRFVEEAPDALGVLRANVAALGARADVELVAGDALSPARWGEERHDVVLCDPPYGLLEQLGGRARVFGALGALAERLAPEGVIVLHAPRGRVEPPELPPGLSVARRRYGTNDLWYMQAEAERA